MARERSPNRDKAFEIYKAHKGDIALREIARILNTPEKTISGWKVKDEWNNKLNGVLQKKIRSTPNSKDNRKVKDKEPKLQEVEEIINNSELTDKQRLFCIYYVKYFNATKAYQKAYDCDYITANTNGPRLLVNACIKDEITKLKADKLKGAMLEPGDILQKYIDIAFADITDFLIFGQEEVPVINAFGPVLDEDGEPVTKMVNTVKFRTWANVDGTLISEIGQGKDGSKLKLYDKMKALDWLANHMDLLDTQTKEKLDIEQQKLQIAKEKLELDKFKVNGSGNEGNKEGIEEFIKATTMTEEDIKQLFKGDEDGQEETN